MASLTAHLVESGGHGRLGFHPNCPACRQERLFGSLASDAVVSRRTQAALASGVLALSVVGPPAALAQEPDQQVEGGLGADLRDGTGETGSGLPDVPTTNPETETAPPSAVVPPSAPGLDADAAPEGSGGSDLQEVVPVELAPVEVPTAPTPPPSEPEAGTPPEQADPDDPLSEAEPPPVAPDTPEESPLQDEVSSDVDMAESPTDHSKPAPPDEKTSDNVRPDKPGAKEPHPSAPPAPAESLAPPDTLATEAPAAPTAAVPPAEPVPTSASSDIAEEEAPLSRTNGRFLVVQPGDSLWSIAKRLLGPGATPAVIARKVDRLWKLNADRIGTGRPDLIFAGTKLRLR